MNKKIMDRAEKAIKKKQRPTFVNIGAYNGKDCLRVCDISTGSFCHAIEACPVNYEVIVKATLGNPNIQCHNIAIADSNGKVQFYVSNHKKSVGTSQANSLYSDYIDEKEWAKKVIKCDIPGYTLDKFCSKNNILNIDLLRINCEGGEYKIFSAPTLNFLNFTHMIDIGIHGKSDLFNSKKFFQTRKHIVKSLKDAGFTLEVGPTCEEIYNSTTHTRSLWKKRTS